MKNKIFLQVFLPFVFFVATSMFSACSLTEEKSPKNEKEIYEWRIYTLTEESKVLDNFFETVLIPAYNRQGVTVGAFCPYKEGKDELRYLLFTYPNIETYNQTKKNIACDETYLNGAKPFFEITAQFPAYSSYETYLCEAFDKVPVMRKPGKERTLFEFRIYHSPNEDANQRKINMFNDEEISLFDTVGIQSVCYGEILAGLHMPALIYLTWHTDEEARNAGWKRFEAHPDWDKMKVKEEYRNTATKNQARLLSPLSYSQL